MSKATFYDGKEVSTIKPKIKVIKDRNGNNKKEVKVIDQPGKPEEIKFYYSTLAYDSYAKEGFTPPREEERSDFRERDFLGRVNIEYGPIKVRITRMFRIKAIDYSTEKQLRKEYLYFESEWIGHDHWGGEIRHPVTHEEGRYVMQTRKLVNKVNEQGKLTSMYVRGEPKTAYSIPFTKAEVDKYLKGEHPFGPDSINITDPDNVVFYGKLEHADTGTMPFRCYTYSYEQFITPEWRDFAELGARPGGPIGRVWKRNKEVNQSHIT